MPKLLAFLLCAASAGFGQTAPAPPAFEVASVKAAPPLNMAMMRSGQMHLGIKVDRAQADFGGMNVSSLIAYAYRVKSYQVSGPDWINEDRFDILGKLPEGAPVEQVPEMMQALLAERFKLVAHWDSKEFPVYAMVVGKGGSKLAPKPADYVPANNNPIRPMTMDNYAGMLSGSADRPVINQTELQGEYMVSMEPVMHALMGRARAQAEQMAAASGGRGPSEAASDPSDSAIFNGVQALGLKLEPRRMPLRVMVVDRLEKPGEN